MKKIWLTVILAAILFGLINGCGNSTAEEIADDNEFVSDEENEEEPEKTVDAADGYDLIGGTWEVGGVYYNFNYYYESVVDIHDNEALEDLYDSVYLDIYEDGTFLYYNLFFYRGEYVCYELDGEETSFLLKIESASKLQYEDGEVSEEEIEFTHRTYIVTPVEGDANTMEFSEFDAVTGKPAVDYNTLLFVKSGEDSEYIDEKGVELADDTDNSEQQAVTPAQAETTTAPETPATRGESNALETAYDYLDAMAFSYSGLVDQLEYEGFTYAEATYAADNCGADWNEQAVRSAEEYLDIFSFSYNELVEQLEYEGFTHSQAVYGADMTY